ncbi:hypothetical protein GCM10012275_08000 [Longimycelium tulufanense]|uniref:Head-to-tail adaptor n=1 Tax=Longimycelium tulufanense TaxID=907463 RepID=A0A8J3C6C2_9PSEU|nr:hypothetical protein [Longimycelium tulufanense]GGM39534.1 hypothetical protein GCM10012275_08000 [Longimycelium tulufanense]
MVMSTFAALEDFTARLSAPLLESERGRAVALLEDATTLILTHLGWPAVPPSFPPALRVVCVSVALRCYLNPLGITSEQMGDYSYRRASTSVAGMSLTRNEQRMVDRAVGRSAATTVRTPLEIDDTDRATWSPLVHREWGYYR